MKEYEENKEEYEFISFRELCKLLKKEFNEDYEWLKKEN